MDDESIELDGIDTETQELREMEDDMPRVLNEGQQYIITSVEGLVLVPMDNGVEAAEPDE